MGYDDLDVIDEALKRGNAMKQIQVHFGKDKDMKLSFGHLPGKYQHALNLPQFENEDMMSANLKKICNWPIEFCTKLVNLKEHEDYAEATIENWKTKQVSKVKARYVVGCDGAHSAVRKSLNLSFLGKKYADEFCLCDCTLTRKDKLPMGSPNDFHIYNDKKMILFFPYANGTYRIMFTREPEKFGEEATLEEVQEAIALVPGELTASDPTWVAKFNLHARGVDKHGSKRVFVAG